MKSKIITSIHLSGSGHKLEKINLKIVSKKSIIILIVISLFLQGCYSYKAINPSCSCLTVDKTYRIKQQNELEKVKIKSFTDSTITVVKNDTLKTIPRNSITTIQEKQLSAGGTMILVIPITTIALTSLILTMLFK